MLRTEKETVKIVEKRMQRLFFCLLSSPPPRHICPFCPRSRKIEIYNCPPPFFTMRSPPLHLTLTLTPILLPLALSQHQSAPTPVPPPNYPSSSSRRSEPTGDLPQSLSHEHGANLRSRVNSYDESGSDWHQNSPHSPHSPPDPSQAYQTIDTSSR